MLGRAQADPNGVKAVADATVVPLSGNSSGNAVWMDGADSQQKVKH